MSREWLLRNLMLGLYDLTDEQEAVAVAMAERVETEEQGWGVRRMIDQMEQQNAR